MYRKIAVVISFVFALLFTGTVWAEPNTPQHTDPLWEVSYWNNKTLSGSPVVHTTESNIDWNWGQGGPANVGNDNFSARWTKFIDVEAGSYRFTATADDGIRVYVDDDLVINAWSDHPAQTYVADINLTHGHHQVTVEYYEHTGYAVAKVSWTATSTPITEWRGAYFDNKNLSGVPLFIRNDANINFDWDYGGPGNGLANDHFSVRWSRTLNLQAGNYTFTVTGDDGVRLWVDGHLLIDKWFDQAATSYSGTIYVSGSTEVVMEYYENAGRAVAQLWWTREGTPPPPPPPPPPSNVVIVDESDAGFVRGGSATSWHTAAVGYGNDMIWTKNNDRLRSNYNWARWYPTLAATQYEVFVFIPANNATTRQARYWVSHRDGYTLRIVNQVAYSNEWVSLGTYWFQGSNNDYVSLADVTFESYLSRRVGFDAMKWEAR